MADSEERAEEIRQGIADAGMNMLDVVDNDFAPMLETFCEHILLMQRELMQRGMSRVHSAQVLTSFSVGILCGDD